jgi:ribosomal-protein-alanine N-acetyltransferase
MKLPIIETRRLFLRPLMESDAKDLYEYAKTEQVGPKAGWDPHVSISDSYKFISLLKEPKTEKHPILFAIELKSESKMIGTIDFHDYNRFIKQAEVGYALNPSYWGCGYVTEALRVLIEFGFNRLNINRIQIMHDPNNHASRRVIEKIDFKYEGELRDRIKNIDGSYSNASLYSILRTEYEHNELSWQFELTNQLIEFLGKNHIHFDQWFLNLGYLEQFLMKKWGYDRVIERICTNYHYLSVVGNDNGYAVMKFYLDEKTYNSQLQGMKVLDTISAKVLASSDEHLVILMEHCSPGVTLDTVGDDYFETKLFADLIRREQYKLPDKIYKHQLEWLDTLYKYIEEPGVKLAHDLLSAIETVGNHALIHGDMHHYNIIKYGNDWRVIDPFGIAAHPYFEVCSFLKNNINKEQVEEQFNNRVKLLSELLGYKEQMILEVTYVYFVLSNVWHLEDDGKYSDEMNQLINIVRKRLGGYIK